MKYCEQIVKDIIEAIEKGLSNKSACEYVGIAEKTFYKWKDEKSEFCKKITRAHSTKKIELLEKIKKAGDQDWRAWAFILERCFPDEFGVKTRTITHEGDKVDSWQDLEDEIRKEDKENEANSKGGEDE